MVLKKVVTFDLASTSLKDLPYLEAAFDKGYDKDLNENKKIRLHLSRYPKIFRRLFMYNMKVQGCSGAHVQRIVSMYGLELFKKQHSDLIKQLNEAEIWNINPILLGFTDFTIKYNPTIPAGEQPVWLQSLDYVGSEIDDLSNILGVSKTYLTVIILCEAFITGNIPQNIKNELSKELELFNTYLETQKQEEEA